MSEATVHWGQAHWEQKMAIGRHQLLADEPADSGGLDLGPAPHDFLLLALGACTGMTLRMYAERKGWPLTDVEVLLSQEKVDGVHTFRRQIRLVGPLSEEQQSRLIDIANKCPVHKTLTGQIRVETQALPSPTGSAAPL